MHRRATRKRYEQPRALARGHHRPSRASRVDNVQVHGLRSGLCVDQSMASSSPDQQCQPKPCKATLSLTVLHACRTIQDTQGCGGGVGDQIWFCRIPPATASLWGANHDQSSSALPDHPFHPRRNLVSGRSSSRARRRCAAEEGRETLHGLGTSSQTRDGGNLGTSIALYRLPVDPERWLGGTVARVVCWCLFASFARTPHSVLVHVMLCTPLSRFM